MFTHGGIKGVTFIGDLGLPLVKNYIGGQKEAKTDSLNVNYSRDFEYKLLADIVNAKKGNTCSKCKKGKLEEKRGIEWGHTFKIDHFYTKPQEGNFVDKDGQQKPLWMGSYGIGLGRSLATIVETHHDEKGIIWPESVSPFQVHLLAVGEQDAEDVYKKLKKENIDVLYDDRADVSAGVKFSDADLIGIPIRLVVSPKTGQKIEWKNRDSKKTELLPIAEVIKRIA